MQTVMLSLSIHVLVYKVADLCTVLLVMLHSHVQSPRGSMLG